MGGFTRSKVPQLAVGVCEADDVAVCGVHVQKNWGWVGLGALNVSKPLLEHGMAERPKRGHT